MEAPDEAQWDWIKPHADRGTVILISPRLDLKEAGKRMAADDTETIQAWIADQKISKPTPEQLLVWSAEPQKRFLILVVQPYVLIQEIGFH